MSALSEIIEKAIVEEGWKKDARAEFETIRQQRARIAELEAALAQIRQDAEWMAHAWMTLRLGSGLLDTDALNHFDDVANRILNTEQKLNVTL